MISFASKVPIVNFFIRPYERATAYTGDRIALAKIEGDISSGVSVMNKLLVGRTLGYSVNPAGVVDQNLKAERDVFTTISRLTMPLPHTLTRYADLIEYARVTYPDQYARFAAENPGLAEPEAAGARHDGGGLRLPGVLGGQAGGVKRGSND